MQINIHYSGKLSDKLELFIRKKLSKLEQYYDRIVSIDVFLKTDQAPGNPKVVDIKLAMPGPDLFATSKSDTFQKAHHLSVDKIKRQLVKRKEHMSKH